MAKHWGDLHAATPLSHNRLVSQRAQACHHAERQAKTAASATGWCGDVLKVALHAEQHISSVGKCGCPFMCLLLVLYSIILGILYLTLLHLCVHATLTKLTVY